MLAQKNSVVNVADVDVDLYPFLVRYRDGRVERSLRSPFVAASDNPSANRGVATRDVIVDPSTGVSARLFLPSRAAAAAAMGTARRLPIVVYFHGGSFCTESAFCRTYHRYATSLAAGAGALVVSVEYRRLDMAMHPRQTTAYLRAQRRGLIRSTTSWGAHQQYHCFPGLMLSRTSSA
ncbi:hypothetical protein BS78_05G224800 [Paspalum vaginatum]|nr:hypothetical protein BS78_05G224800 [Paspalum vaginatum]